MARHGFIGDALAVGYCLLVGAGVAVLVFTLAYAQEVAFWNHLFDGGADWAVATLMAAIAFVVSARATWRDL